MLIQKKKDFKDCASEDLCSHTIAARPGLYPIVLWKRL